jgi:hypothetical protein
VRLVYEVLNVFFLVFHTGLLFFNLFGWIPRATRRWNLVTLGLTLLSWVGLGAFYGLGYCICTDWHWRVRRALGIHDPYNSYVQFLIADLTGLKVSEAFTYWLTAAAFAFAVVMSLWVNLRDFRRGRRESAPARPVSNPEMNEGTR